MSGYEVLLKLLADPYYETVPTGFIAMAIETAVQEHGPFSSYEEMNQYIKENLI